MSDVFWYPADLMYSYPFVPFIPTMVLGFYYLIKRGDHPSQAFRKNSLFIIVAAALWLLYGMLECALYMWEKANTGIGTPIRIDTFLVYPLLLITLPLGVIGVWKLNRPGIRDSSNK